MDKDKLLRLRIDNEKAFLKKKKRKIIYTSTFIILIFIFGFLYKKGILSVPIKVRVAAVTLYHPSQALTILNATGYVVPERKSALASKITGRLIWIGVKEGSRVRKGQIIARLESKDLEASKKQAEANVKIAQYNLEYSKTELREASLWLERNKFLYEKGVIAKASYDAAVSRYEKAVSAVEASEASLKAALAVLEATEASLEHTVIRSPFDGIILTKNADVGDVLTPISAAAEAKLAVVTIADMDSIQVEADISETNLSLIKKGQPCEIQIDGIPEKRFPGEINMIIPTIDRTKATATVKIKLIEKDSRILPQMSAKITFFSRRPSIEEQKPRIAIPRSAVFEIGDTKNVFLLINDRVKKRKIEMGLLMGEMVEVINSLKIGDKVIINPSTK